MRALRAERVGPNRFRVDMRGWMCPYPKYAVEMLLAKLPAGGTLELLVDCPAATADVPRVAAAKGYITSGVLRIGEGEWQVTLEAPKNTGA